MTGCNQAGQASKKAAGMIYVLFIFLSALLAMVLKTWGKKLMVHVPGAGDYGCTEDWCYGNESVYRVSFGVVLFFAVNMLVAPFCKAWHTGMWGVKFLLLPALVAAAYFVPAPFYDHYESFARWASSLFILLQCLILIEFSYDMHEWLVQKADEADQASGEASLCSNRYRALYIALSATFTVGSVVGCIAMYSYFGCGAGPATISLTLLAVLVFTAVSVSEWGRGLLVGSTISIYVTWLEFSAMTSMPSDVAGCNPFASMGSAAGDDSTSVWLGLLFAAVSVGYAGYSAATGALDALSLEGDDAGARAGARDASASDGEEGARIYQQLAEGQTDAEAMNAERDRERAADLEAGSTRRRRQSAADSLREAAGDAGQIALFHFVMLCCGFYLGMVLTNWADTPDNNGTSEAAAGTSRTSMWVKLISQYITMALYTWSIFAPMVCSGRDFD
jgi:hypothetical protein